jgi:hypothetical protein
MKRRSLALGAMAALVLSASPAAQTHPSFSGRWIPSTDPGASNGAPVLGPEVRITQDATTVAIEIIVIVGNASGTTSQTQRLVYKLDGSDSPQDVRTASGPADPTRTMAMWTAASMSRAGWNNDRLVIVTHDTLKFSFPDGSATPPVETRLRTDWQSLSIEGDGTLVAERLSIIDPLPRLTVVREPRTVRTVYKRAVQPTSPPVSG